MGINRVGALGIALVGFAGIVGAAVWPESSKKENVSQVEPIGEAESNIAQIKGVASKKIADALQIVNDEKSRLAHELAPWGEGVGIDSNDRVKGVSCEVSRSEPVTYRYAAEDARQAVSEIYAEKGLIVDSFDNESVHTQAKVFYPRALYGGDDVIVCVSSVATKILDKDGKRVPTSRKDVNWVSGGMEQ